MDWDGGMANRITMKVRNKNSLFSIIFQQVLTYRDTIFSFSNTLSKCYFSAWNFSGIL